LSGRRFSSARESLLRFAGRGGAAAPEVRKERGRLYEVWRCADGSTAQLVLHRGGHTWLGDGVRIGGSRARVAKGSVEIVEFFRRDVRGG
jgi:hypothetical protein